MTGEIILALRILLALCLYGFLGWAVVTIWRDLRAQGQIISTPNIPPVCLAFLDEQDDQRQVFHSAEIVIGRSANSEYYIADETVSARHARLSYHHNQWWIEDLNSTNGTFLNDERVHVPTVVVTGDELRCGQVNLSIEIQEKPGRNA